MFFRPRHLLSTLAVMFAAGCSGDDGGGCVSGPLCDGGGDDTPEPVASVSVTAAQASVVIGASVQLSASTFDAAGTFDVLVYMGDDHSVAGFFVVPPGANVPDQE